MARPRSERTARPLDPQRLDALAIHYVGRFATTEKRLADYLSRKLAERGWAGDAPPPVDAIVARCVAAGYVDDRSYAAARAAALGRRGYGGRRIAQSLQGAGIARAMADAVAPDRDAAFAAAEAFARRRRFGPFGDGTANAVQRQRQFAALVRAGHDFDLARYFSTALTSGDNDGAKSA